MVLVPLVGKMGGGKTATMTYLLYKDFKAQKEHIFSNYRLNFPRRKDGYLPEPLDLTLFADPTNNKLNNCSVGGDEFWTIADSRNSSSKVNRMISAIILQSRKRQSDFYFTSQSFMQLDKRIRDNCDYVIHCKKKGDFTFLLMINRHDPNKVRKYKIYLPILYDLYNTNEIVNPLGARKIETAIELSEEETDIENPEDILTT